MNKKEFEEGFKKIIKKRKVVYVELKNSDTIIADAYLDNEYGDYKSVWLRRDDYYVALINYSHVGVLY